MELNCRKKAISYVMNISIIIILAMFITMHAFFYGSSDILNLHDETTAYEGMEITELEADEVETDNIISASTLKYGISKGNSADTTEKTTSIITYASYPSSIAFNTILIIAFIIFCLSLFKILPDDWTLINQKVRLDD
jgi:hypothetical protein